MSTEESFVRFIADQLAEACPVTYRKMFGEYAFYHGGKVVALACDNRLFVKMTAGGRAYAGPDATEAPAYSGAKPGLCIEDRFEDAAWLAGLIRITAAELPEPKKKR